MKNSIYDFTHLISTSNTRKVQSMLTLDSCNHFGPFPEAAYAEIGRGHGITYPFPPATHAMADTQRLYGISFVRDL